MRLSPVSVVLSGLLTGLGKSYACVSDLASMTCIKHYRQERNYSRIELFLLAGVEHV